MTAPAGRDLDHPHAAIRVVGRLRTRVVPEDRSRFTGVAAVMVLWTLLPLAIWRSGFPLLGPRPLSWMVEDPASAPLFRVALVVSAVLFVAFHGYVRARHPVDRWFSVAMLGGMAGQLVAAAVPIDGGALAHQVHTFAALGLGLSLPVLMWRFAACQPDGRWRRAAWSLFAVEAAACVVGVVLSRSSVAPLAEIVPAAGFHLWIVTITARPLDRGAEQPAARLAPAGAP